MVAYTEISQSYARSSLPPTARYWLMRLSAASPVGEEQCSQMGCSYNHCPRLNYAHKLLLLEFPCQVSLCFGRDQDVFHLFVILPHLAVLQRMGWSREDDTWSAQTPDASARSLEWQK